MSKPLILLANDDGFRAEGLQALRGALSEFAEVVVCAPASEQSAMSHSLTLHRPLRLVRHEPGVFSVDGTPADCVYVALHSADRVVPRRPDLVLSGLNHGVNLGDDVFYSGTVAAAREAALKGIPAIAVSADNRADRQAAVGVAARLAQSFLGGSRDELTLLNVNFPPGSDWKLAATRLGTRRYLDAVEFRRDPRG
ncbi:MAG: 5'/3'-nucleotidase SurE, partial [Myxococcales bacterium]|nr:5'/3'-nucleotidase SurE [Myxococcales bacterium]